MYKAHINENTEKIQSVKEHSENTARLCSEFSVDELKKINYTIGILHDIGKYQAAFQRRIDGAGIRVEHSVCAAKEIRDGFRNDAMALMMEYCIAGHHSGIPVGGNPSETHEYTALQNK